jgi:hypothetical protein
MERGISFHDKGRKMLRNWRSGISVLHFGSRCLDAARERGVIRTDLGTIEAGLISVISDSKAEVKALTSVYDKSSYCQGDSMDIETTVRT